MVNRQKSGTLQWTIFIERLFCMNFRVITANIFSVPKFRTFTVYVYHNDPKFSDRYPRANSADPDQTASLFAIHSVF